MILDLYKIWCESFFIYDQENAVKIRMIIGLGCLHEIEILKVIGKIDSNY